MSDSQQDSQQRSPQGSQQKGATGSLLDRVKIVLVNTSD